MLAKPTGRARLQVAHAAVWKPVVAASASEESMDPSHYRPARETDMLRQAMHRVKQ